MGIKFKNSILSSPGPSDYNSAKLLSKGSSTHIGLSRRSDLLLEQKKTIPGPSDYNTKSHLTFGSTIKGAPFAGKYI